MKNSSKIEKREQGKNVPLPASLHKRVSLMARQRDMTILAQVAELVEAAVTSWETDELPRLVAGAKARRRQAAAQ